MDTTETEANLDTRQNIFVSRLREWNEFPGYNKNRFLKKILQLKFPRTYFINNFGSIGVFFLTQNALLDCKNKNIQVLPNCREATRPQFWWNRYCIKVKTVFVTNNFNKSNPPASLLCILKYFSQMTFFLRLMLFLILWNQYFGLKYRFSLSKFVIFGALGTSTRIYN